MSLEVGERLEAVVVGAHEKRRRGSVIGVGLLIGNEGRQISRTLAHETVVEPGARHEDVDFARADALFEFVRRNAVVDVDRIRRKGRPNGFERDFDRLRRLRRFRKRNDADAKRALLENRKGTPGDSVERRLVGGTQCPLDKSGRRHGGRIPSIGLIGRRRRSRRQESRREKNQGERQPTGVAGPNGSGPAPGKGGLSHGRRKRCSKVDVRSAHG